MRRTLAEQPLSGDLLSRMAENESVSPALAATAAQAAEASNAGEPEFEKAFTRALNNHLLAADAQPVPKPRTGTGLTWRRDCLNTNIDIAEFLDELDPNVGARFLLYGPAGTGKTAWGRQLAEEIERPLVVKRSSELVNPYVGVTEKNIAKAFHQAEEDNAVLLIDEADSFLDDRNQARQSWQISHVNQFLASMEEFDGFLVCTTNFDSRMDIASMRRFDFRVGFDYLTIGQAALLFADLCGLAGIAAPDHDTLMVWLAGMTRLAPGDFHVLARRLRIRKHSTSAEKLLEELQKECAYKEPEGRAIGFRADIH